MLGRHRTSGEIDSDCTSLRAGINRMNVSDPILNPAEIPTLPPLHILCVDDDPSILKTLARLFHGEAFQVLTATSGSEGLAILQEYDSVGLIMSDQRMGGMSGTTFLESAALLAPDSIRILLTGHADLETAVTAVNQARVHRFFTKPWDDQEILQTVRDSLHRYQLAKENQRLSATVHRQNDTLSEWNCRLTERVEEETKIHISQARQLANHSRMAAMGEMISAIAHQWRQPLSTLAMIVQRTHAMGTMNELTPEYLGEFKVNAMRQIKHMSDTIEEFRGFYLPEKTKVLFSPAACVSDSLRLFEPQFTSSAIAVSVTCQGCNHQQIHGYPNEFKQVILNLLGNARDGIMTRREICGEPEKGLIHVEIDASQEQGMTLDVSDNGCGMAADVALKIFNPYFTTKEESGGTGIGLYMSRMIVEDSLGGRLLLLSQQDPTTFRIELPTETQR